MDPGRLWFSLFDPITLVGLPVVGCSGGIVGGGGVGRALFSATPIFTSVPTPTELAPPATLAPTEVLAPEIPVLPPVEEPLGRGGG